MKLWIYLVILLAATAGLVACAAESASETPSQTSPDPAGPALIMFYTDN